MNLKWSKPGGEKRKWSDSDVREHRELTARKLVWTLNDAGAQPIGEKGWLRSGVAPMGARPTSRRCLQRVVVQSPTVSFEVLLSQKRSSYTQISDVFFSRGRDPITHVRRGRFLTDVG